MFSSVRFTTGTVKYVAAYLWFENPFSSAMYWPGLRLKTSGAMNEYP